MTRCLCRRGFSLLEVILALAIMAGSMAVLGEITRQALQSAEYARDLTRAELLCESQLAQVLAGITTTDSVQNSPLEVDEDDRSWLYSVSTQQADDLGLLAVTVSVTRDVPPGVRPPTVTLTRWMLDPTMTYPLYSSSSSGSSPGGSSP